MGTGLEDGRFVCCWVVQELGGGARTGAGPGSAGQEGGRGVRGDGLGTEGDEVGVVGGGEGVDGFGGGEGLLAEGFSFAALCGVEDENAVGEVGDAGVVPERTSRSVQRLAFRGRCPARVLRYSQGHAASRGTICSNSASLSVVVAEGRELQDIVHLIIYAHQTTLLLSNGGFINDKMVRC